jgi:hypothetical protein
VAKQIEVNERFLHFGLDEWLHNLLVESWVSLPKEEVQLMACVLGELCQLLRLVKGRPDKE